MPVSDSARIRLPPFKRFSTALGIYPQAFPLKLLPHTAQSSRIVPSSTPLDRNPPGFRIEASEPNNLRTHIWHLCHNLRPAHQVIATFSRSFSRANTVIASFRPRSWAHRVGTKVLVPLMQEDNYLNPKTM